ncbi:MAG: tetratricopeptide repeat protein [Cyanobacteria bacterium SZAS-4]|nr:tetratricopeptide repeat protein [Cyanobacteria bacterium SZAS-4]
MDDVVELYERANDLAKAGKNDEAIAEYRAGIAILEKSTASDRSSRLTYFASKLATLLFKLERFDEARPYYKMMGQEMPTPPIQTLGLMDAIKVAKQAGLFGELGDEELEKILTDLGVAPEEVEDDEEFGLINIVQSYYHTDDDSDAHLLSPRAVKDGFISHDWRFGQETDDVVAELCQLVGKPIWRQLEYADEPRTDCVATTTYLHVQSDTGEKAKVEVNGLEDIVAFMNQSLEKRGDNRRFASCDTKGDWYAYFLIGPAAYKKVFSGKNPALSCDDVPGINRDNW